MIVYCLRKSREPFSVIIHSNVAKGKRMSSAFCMFECHPSLSVVEVVMIVGSGQTAKEAVT